MPKENEIATAANSKTMNAVEEVKLYAAAGETEPLNNINKTGLDLREPDPALNNPLGKKEKQKRKSKHKKP